VRKVYNQPMNVMISYLYLTISFIHVASRITRSLFVVHL